MRKKFKSSEVIYYDNLKDYFRNASCTSLSIPSRVLNIPDSDSEDQVKDKEE
jgi:hypothetical protein